MCIHAIERALVSIVIVGISSLLLACGSLKLQEGKDILFESVFKGIGSIQVLLKHDGSFKYKSVAGLLGGESQGTWRLKGKDTIILASNIAYKTGYIVEVTEKKQASEQRTIKIIDTYGDTPLGFAIILFGENEYIQTNEEGIAVVGDKKYDNLTIIFLSDKLKWKFSKSPEGDLEVRLTLSDMSKIYLDNEIWILKKRKLIAPGGTIFKKVRSY